MNKRRIAFVVAAAAAAVGLTAPSAPAHAQTAPPPSGYVLAPSDIAPYNPATGNHAPPGTSSRAAAAGTVAAAGAYVDRGFQFSSVPPYVTHRSQLSVEQEQSSLGYFYADQFKFNNSGDNNGYIGIQNHMWTDHDVGKGVVFSIWAATSFDTSGCASMGCVGVSGVEGTPFLSIRLPFQWTAGWTYEVRLVRGHTGNVLNQRVDATIIDKTHNITYSVGALNVPTQWEGFANFTYQWTEPYVIGQPFTACSQVPRTSVVWGGITTMATPTGGSLTPNSSVPHIASGPGICTNSNSYYLGQGGYREVIGGTV
jgi:hypothetical protein